MDFNGLARDYMTNNWTIMVYISADDVLANFAIDSLNQLRRAAGQGNIVAAQFDPNDGTESCRFRFDGNNISAPLMRVRRDIGRRNMAEPDTLTNFINWASKPLNEPKGRHYCLILWGHGTELLLDQDSSRKRKRYLTPWNLKRALEGTRLARKNRKLDIVAFDACSMSMVELASALPSCVQFMIASQEDVPDESFPYERILKKLKGRGVVGICKMIPELYHQSFQDYLVTPRNGTGEITLSSINLAKIEIITNAVKGLAGSLLGSVDDKDVSDAVVSARQHSRDFVLGLFVDLYDFCQKLPECLRKTGCENKEGSKEHSKELTDACDHICNVIDKKRCIIANETRRKGKDCHGLSIYFPYSVQKNENQQTKKLLGNAETGILNLPLLKGGTNNTRKARNGRIEELEADFAHLPFFKEDGWGAFIKKGWSLVLARRFPRNIDLHYSAQQCAQNLLPLAEKTLPIISKPSKKKTRQPIAGHPKKRKLQLVPPATKKEARSALEPKYRRVG
jgi:hypothetical protein